MVSTLLIFAVSICALAMVWSVVYRNGQQAAFTVADWEKKKWEIDVEIFRSLLDGDEERYLAMSLPPDQFEIYQRRRIQLALRMVRLAKENADMLVRLGVAARIGNDPALAREADLLVAAATQFRANLVLAKCCLWVRWAFPRWRVSVPSIEGRYSQMLDSLMRVQQCGWQA
jgi:hypothetical protein